MKKYPQNHLSNQPETSRTKQNNFGRRGNFESQTKKYHGCHITVSWVKFYDFDHSITFFIEQYF